MDARHRSAHTRRRPRRRNGGYFTVLDKPLTLTRLPACDLTRHPLMPKVHPDFDPAGEKADLTVIVSSAYCTHLRDR